MAPYRRDAFDGHAAVPRRRKGPNRGSVLAVTVDGIAKLAGEVATVDTENHPDGGRYLRVGLARPPRSPRSAVGAPLSGMRASVLSLRAALSGLVKTGYAVTGTAVGTTLTSIPTVSGVLAGNGWVVLDAFYPQLTANTVAAVEQGRDVHARAQDHRGPGASTTRSRVGSGTSAVTQNVPASLVIFP